MNLDHDLQEHAGCSCRQPAAPAAVWLVADRDPIADAAAPGWIDAASAADDEVIDGRARARSMPGITAEGPSRTDALDRRMTAMPRWRVLLLDHVADADASGDHLDCIGEPTSLGAPMFLFNDDDERDPALDRPPVERPRVDVPGHGVVHVGETLGGGGNRPYIWVWLEPVAGNDCGTTGSYRWYQFVRVSFHIDGRPKDPSTEMKAATGRTIRWNKWDADYTAADPDTRGPGLRPPGLDIPERDPGQPFRPTEVPGTRTSGRTSRLAGIVDAPQFCNRGVDDETDKELPSPIERLTFDSLRNKTLQQTERPAAGEVTAQVVVETRTYLVCVRDGEARCIGYVEWTYSNTARIEVSWSRARQTVNELVPVWAPDMRIVECRNDLAITGWRAPC